MPFKHNPLSDVSLDEYMEDILLIKGWRRYTWQESMLIKMEDTLKNSSTLNFKGTITKHGKAIKKPLQVSVIADSSLSILKTDAEGNFELEPNNLVISTDKKVSLFVVSNVPQLYDINLNDPFAELNKKLASNCFLRIMT